MQRTLSPCEIPSAQSSELLIIQKRLQEIKNDKFGELRIHVRNGYVYDIERVQHDYCQDGKWPPKQ